MPQSTKPLIYLFSLGKNKLYFKLEKEEVTGNTSLGNICLYL